MDLDLRATRSLERSLPAFVSYARIASLIYGQIVEAMHRTLTAHAVQCAVHLGVVPRSFFQKSAIALGLNFGNVAITGLESNGIANT